MVSYGEPAGFSALFRILGTMILVNLLPNGKSFKLYGTSTYFLFDPQPYLDDWAVFFGLLEAGKIKPVIMKKFPLQEAALAHEMLENGQVTGNLVLVAPGLL